MDKLKKKNMMKINPRYDNKNLEVVTNTKSSYIQTSQSVLSNNLTSNKSNNAKHKSYTYVKEFINEIIDKSVDIGEFHSIHKINQKNFENRKVKKELNFFSNEFNIVKPFYTKKILKYFTSNLLKRIFYLDNELNLLMIDILSENKEQKVKNETPSISLQNIYDTIKSPIDAVLFENKEVNLCLLFSDLTFCYYKRIDDLFFSDNETPLQSVDKNSRLFYKLIESKSRMFDFSVYIPNLKNEKLKKLYFHIDDDTTTSKRINICPSDENNLIFNFTEISDRIILFNIKSYSVIYNIRINTFDFFRINIPSLYDSVEFFLFEFLNKKWTVLEAEKFSNLVTNIIENKKKMSNYKILANLICHIDQNLNNMDDIFFLTIKDERCKRISNKNLDKKIDTLFICIINLLTASLSTKTIKTQTGTDMHFDLFQLLSILSKLLKKISYCSILYENADITGIKDNVNTYISRLNLFFIKTFKRNLDLKEIFTSIDKEKKYYVPSREVVRIFNSLPLGMTQNEIKSFLTLDEINYFDEYNNFLYPHLFLKEEYLINKLIDDRKKDFNKKDYFGFFTKNSASRNLNFEFVKYRTKRKNSDPLERNKLLDAIGSIKVNKNNKKNINSPTQLLSQLIITECLDITIQSFIYISNLNLFLTLNSHKIFIFKIDSNFDNKSKIEQSSKLIGFIDTDSHFNNKIMYYMPDENLILVSTLSNPVDLVLIDVYKDIVDLYQTNRHWKIRIEKENIRKIKNISLDKIIDINYMYGNKLIFIRDSCNKIKLINPKSGLTNLSIRYQQSIESIYDHVCRIVCEKPSEMIGDPIFKVVKEIKVGVENSKNITTGILNFRDETNYHPFEYLLIVDNTTISVYSVYSVYINLSAKSLDIPLSDSEYHQMIEYTTNEKKKIIKSILNLNSKRKSGITDMNKKDETICTIITQLKNNVLGLKISNNQTTNSQDFLTGYYNTLYTNTHDLVALMKYLNINYEYNDILSNTNFFHSLADSESDSKNKISNLISNTDKIKIDVTNWKRITEVFLKLGLNSICTFRQIKNNKIEFIKYPKPTYENLIKSKINLFCLRCNINHITDDDKNLMSDIKENDITYELFEKNVFKGNSKFRSPLDKIQYKENNVSTIFELLSKLNEEENTNSKTIFNATINSKSDEFTANIHNRHTPLQSGVKKLVRCFYEKEIKFNASFNIFDVNNEEIIDKKQFIDGLKSLNLNMNTLEIDSIFNSIDQNAAGCVTEEEYSTYVTNYMYEVLKEIKKDISDRLQDKMYKNLVNIFNTNMIDCLFKKKKIVYDENIQIGYDITYLTFLKLFNFIETHLGIQIERSFKFFDVLFNGVIFYSQFRYLLEKNQSGLTDKEIDVIFCFIDRIDKKLFINENEYYSVIKSVLHDPGANKKKYKRILNLNTSEDKNCFPSNSSHITNVKISDYSPDEYDYCSILFAMINRLANYLISNKIVKSQDLLHENMDKFKNPVVKYFYNNLEYLPVEEFISKIHIIFNSMTKFELKLIIDYYIDINKYGVIYLEKFTNYVEKFVKYVINTESTGILLGASSSLPIEHLEIHSNTVSSSFTDKLKSNVDLNNSNVNSNQQLFLILKLIQDNFRSTGYEIEKIFYLLDKNKKGFVTLSSVLENLPLKFNLNLTINQITTFFNYLDKDKDGIFLMSDFVPFYETQFTNLTFDDQALEFYSVIEKFQENFLIFMTKLKVDLRNIFDCIAFGGISYDKKTSDFTSINEEEITSYIEIPQLLHFFNIITNKNINFHDFKIILDLIFNYSSINVNYIMGLRKFIIMLEHFGVNTLRFLNYKELNEIIDLSMLNLLKNINSSSILEILKYFETYDGDRDGFLTAEELNSALEKFKTNSNIKSVIYRFADFNNKNLISITNLSFHLIYFNNFYANINLKKIPNFGDFCYNPGHKTHHIFNNNNKPTSFDVMTTESKDIVLISTEYERLILKGCFSGLIIYSKSEENRRLMNLINNKNKKLIDYFALFSKKGNELIIKNCLKNVSKNVKKVRSLTETSFQQSDYIDFSRIEIPIIRINILDSKEILIKKVLGNLGEIFIYYHPELKNNVEVYKLKKKLLSKVISLNDGQSLLNHIDYSIKVNHFLNKKYYNSSASVCDLFFSNLGIFTREILIDHKPVEEIYIINEMIDEENYMSLAQLIKLNGGLLSIPELFGSDMTFYMIRFWASQILKIFRTLQDNSICLKYINLNDLFISKDGKKIKLRKIMHYSYCNPDNKVISGPDLTSIFILYDKVNAEDISKISNKDKESNILSSLKFEHYDDAFVCPEIILKDMKSYTNKIDSWLFGAIIFSLLFGKEPDSFIHQLKEWIETHTNLIFEKIQFPMDIVSENNHFFFFPYKNLTGYELDKVIVPILDLKSFSAVVPNRYLNQEIENNKTVNGLGIILDLINACLNPNPELRPDVSSLFESDLFILEDYEMILVNKFSINCMQYISPEISINKEILLPLRSIASRVLQNKKIINEFENFIFEVIKRLNEYFFTNNERNLTNSKSELNTSFDKQNISLNSSQIIKFVIENKIIDILNFLIIRHFSLNLKEFKKRSHKKNEETLNINSHSDKKIVLELRKQRNYYIKDEYESECGRLIKPFIDFLYNCVISMTSYDHIISSYVENILEYITRLFIGEDCIFLSLNLTNKLKASSGGLKKYTHYRTFFRNENSIDKNFKEDEADRIWSIMNNNIDLCELKSYWSVELYELVNPLFREAVTESGNGNYKYPVIKNYFRVSTEIEKNTNIFGLFDINDFYKINNIGKKYHTSMLNQCYLSEILALNECAVNLLNSGESKNFSNKKSALVYINSILKNKDIERVRAILDFKIHKFLEKFLYIHNNDLIIKSELLNILKEISLGLVDIDEISWLYGNSYSHIFEATYKNKSELLNDNMDLSEEINCDKNFSLTQFLNKTLQSSHNFILQFSDRFLNTGAGNSTKTTHTSFTANQSTSIIYFKEIGLIFANSLFLKPLLRILRKSSESILIRQTCLEILFNLMVSNNDKIIACLNSTLCNFNEALINLMNSETSIFFNNELNNNVNSSLQDNEYSASEISIMQMQHNFKQTVKNIIYIIIETQNPIIKSQMLKSLTIQKFIKENNLVFTAHIDIDDIYEEFLLINNEYNSTNVTIEKINKLINSFKCWIQNYYLDRDQCSDISNNSISILTKIEKIITSLIHVMNMEWKDGFKDVNKNSLLFNIVKLFEWLCKKKLHRMLFNMQNLINSKTLIINITSKIKDFYNRFLLDERDEEKNNNRVSISKSKDEKIKIKSQSKNPNKILIKTCKSENKITKFSTLNKIFHIISIKLFNILSSIFAMNDSIYNEMFMEIKFGYLMGDLMKLQYEVLGQIFDRKKNEINLLNNYIHENKIRLQIFESFINISNENIKIQFLETGIIEFIISNMMNDYRRFYTDFKKLSFEFLVYKDSYPIRNEAISFINMIINKKKENYLIYDEMLKNIRKFKTIQSELNTIKNSIKGLKIHSVLLFFTFIVLSNNKELLSIMEQENIRDYLNYSIEKDPNLKKYFPQIFKYLNN